MVTELHYFFDGVIKRQECLEDRVRIDGAQFLGEFVVIDGKAGLLLVEEEEFFDFGFALRAEGDHVVVVEDVFEVDGIGVVEFDEFDQMGEQELVEGPERPDHLLQSGQTLEQFPKQSELDQTDVHVLVPLDTQQSLLLNVYENHLQKLNDSHHHDVVRSLRLHHSDQPRHSLTSNQ